MKHKNWMVLVLVSLICIAAGRGIGAQEGRSQSLIDQGKSHYSRRNYEQALLDFRNITLDSSIEEYHGEAFLWLSKTYMALDDLGNAERNLEFFLNRYPNHASHSHGLYLKGRLLYLQREYQKSLGIFQEFLEKYEDSPYRANGIYWAADSLYQLGHLDKARPMFQRIVHEYPASLKVDAAHYRLSLIDLKYREQELLTLIKWSHEESLKALEEYQAREKSYEEAITSYQQKISSLTDKDLEQQAAQFRDEVRIKTEQIASLRQEMGELEARIESLQERLKAAQKDSRGTAVPVSDSGRTPEEIQTKEQLLDLKDRTLSLLMTLLELRTDAAEAEEGEGK